MTNTNTSKRMHNLKLYLIKQIFLFIVLVSLHMYVYHIEVLFIFSCNISIQCVVVEYLECMLHICIPNVCMCVRVIAMQM